MGLTHAEFFKTLAPAINYHPYTVDGERVQIDYEGRRLVIELGPEQVRAIALLRMPHAQVTFSFHHFSEQQREQFMHRFDLYFRRGGG